MSSITNPFSKQTNNSKINSNKEVKEQEDL